VIWPELRDGQGPVPAHLQAWVPARTLEDLGVFLRSDMLSRREALTSAVGITTGAALVEPITRWLGFRATGLTVDEGRGPGRIGMTTVEGIEQATRRFVASDADVGGGLSREAAVGQLKYAVDLAQHASYTEAVGNRLLAAIADLAGWVSWMSYDAGMPGPAQRYSLYGLQAAREAGDERTRLRAAGILTDMAIQMRSAGHPDTGVRLVDLALEQLPPDRRRLNSVRATLWANKASILAAAAQRAEARNAVSLSFDLYGQGSGDISDAAVRDYYPYDDDAELASNAAVCYRTLAVEDRLLAGNAEDHALYALTYRGPGFTRSKVFDQIGLAQARFRKAEPDQACLDGERAIEMSAGVAASRRVVQRLRELVDDSEPYRELRSVRDFRERLLAAV
jgi:hypothetical protein